MSQESEYIRRKIDEELNSIHVEPNLRKRIRAALEPIVEEFERLDTVIDGLWGAISDLQEREE